MAATRIRFWLDDHLQEVEGLAPTTTLLRYLRDELHQTGTKEGCAEGDCGACTVVVVEDEGDGPVYRAVNACLVFLPMVQNKRVYTVHGLEDRSAPAGGLHPAQEAVVELRASQCGYCTPGIVMSLFEASYRGDMDATWKIEDQAAGNLCRCTGYRPIRDAAHRVAGLRPDDRFARVLEDHAPPDTGLDYRAGDRVYLQPTTLDDLWRHMADHPGAVLAAGGTDLGLEVTQRFRDLPQVIGLEGLDALRELRRDDGGWHVGAGVRLTRLLEVLEGRMPAMERMLRVFGSRQIRSRATVGGNLCNASPIGDLAPVLLAMDAVAVAAGPRGEREIPLDTFFTGYRQTALEPDEILLRVQVPDVPAGAFCTSYKVSKRVELDISIVSAGMRVEIDRSGRVRDIRLAYGGVAATPVRARRAEEALRGRPWSRESVEAAHPVLDQEITPITDHRGTAAYRSALVRNLLTAFFLDSARPDRDRLPDRPLAQVLA